MPVSFKPPLRDIHFAFDVLDVVGRTKSLPGYDAVDNGTISMILESAADFAVNYAQPINATGDQVGNTLGADGRVTTAPGFKEAYKIYGELGFAGLVGNPAYGGAGMPAYLGLAVSDMACSANLSLMMCPGLTEGAAKVVDKFASDDLKNLYLPKMYTGELPCTMCLTEPDAGSDLSRVKTAAAPDGDAFRISGNKIFITFGEHDFTDNIAHLVLARLPGAPEGTKGISLFLVPKKDMITGDVNGVSCTHIEEKMGIHASPTCQITFDNAKGYLIGEPNKGLAAMFVMMNDARLKVALQGLSLAEAAYQAAVDYASVRIQGEGKAIIKHGNVLQDLVSMKAHIDGYRLMAYDLAINLDIAKKHPDTATRKTADAYAALMTPVAKACMTDFACAATQKSIQLHGGMGFIKETGVEQFYRDSLIATIYEGTNDIQSHDFVFRKAFDQNGNSTLMPYIAHVLKGAEKAVQKDPSLVDAAMNLERTAQLLGGATTSISSKIAAGMIHEVKADARDYMSAFGAFAVGASWMNALAKADGVARQNGITDAFIQNKKTLGRYYLQHDMLPEAMRAAMRISLDGGLSNIAPETLRL